MVNSARIREFFTHWKHEPNRTEEFARFRIRMLEVLRKLWKFNVQDHEELRGRFAEISGTPCSPSPYFEQSGLNNLVDNAKNEFMVARAVQCMLWSIEELAPGCLDYYCERIKDALELSPGIMIRLVHQGRIATLYPAGVAMLDEALVDENLVWLSRYPTVLKPYGEALKLYLTKDPNLYRSMLDNLRFTLEQLLRVVLNNGRSLENQKEEFLFWLKKHGAHAQIGNMYHQLLFNHFALYQNDAVKHQEDQYAPAEVEFMLYLTGTFLRLIQRLIEDDPAATARKS
jgi:hypothetical protein